MELQNLIVEKELLFRKLQEEFVRIPRVEAFQKSYSFPQSRRKFLVLDGPSRLGKTEFVRSMVEPVAILELNCASVLDPPMKSFDHTVHKLVLFDKGSVDMVVRNKKLVQAATLLVSLATSATNCFSCHADVNMRCSSYAATVGRLSYRGRPWTMPSGSWPTKCWLTSRRRCGSPGGAADPPG